MGDAKVDSESDGSATASRLSWIEAWIESIVAAAIGAALYLLGVVELAELTWIIGLTQSAFRFAITRLIRRSQHFYVRELKKEMEPIHALASVLDVQRKISGDIEEIMKLFLEITEPEFKRVKETIIMETKNKLHKLAQAKSSDELPRASYYSWLFQILENVKAGTRIWAISLMLDYEWEDSPDEEKFLELNLSAPGKGAHLERVFIVDRAKLREFSENKAVKAHINNAGNNLKSYIVEREALQKTDPKLLKDIGYGLLGLSDVNHDVVLVDLYALDGSVRGRVTMNQTEIERLKQMFDEVKTQSRELSWKYLESKGIAKNTAATTAAVQTTGSL